MNIVIFDNSKGKAFKKTRKYLSKTLLCITNRKYIGSLPSRVIREMLFNIKRLISKNSDVLVLVAHKDGFYGWSGYHFGKTKCKEKYAKLLNSNRYLTTGTTNG